MTRFGIVTPINTIATTTRAVHIAPTTIFVPNLSGNLDLTFEIYVNQKIINLVLVPLRCGLWAKEFLTIYKRESMMYRRMKRQYGEDVWSMAVSLSRISATLQSTQDMLQSMESS